jgi:hypothetical protein
MNCDTMLDVLTDNSVYSGPGGGSGPTAQTSKMKFSFTGDKVEAVSAYDMGADTRSFGTYTMDSSYGVQRLQITGTCGNTATVTYNYTSSGNTLSLFEGVTFNQVLTYTR